MNGKRKDDRKRAKRKEGARAGGTTVTPPSCPSSHTLSPPSSHPPWGTFRWWYVWIVFSSRLLFPSRVCVCPTCVRTRVRGPLCGRWVRMRPCVSLCQRPRKGRPKGVVFHFYSFINSPLRSDCVCQIGQNGRRDKAVSGAMGWPLNSPEFFLLWIIMFVIICFISLFNIQAMHHI